MIEHTVKQPRKTVYSTRVVKTLCLTKGVRITTYARKRTRQWMPIVIPPVPVPPESIAWSPRDRSSGVPAFQDLELKFSRGFQAFQKDRACYTTARDAHRPGKRTGMCRSGYTFHVSQNDTSTEPSRWVRDRRAGK